MAKFGFLACVFLLVVGFLQYRPITATLVSGDFFFPTPEVPSVFFYCPNKYCIHQRTESVWHQNGWGHTDMCYEDAECQRIGATLHGCGIPTVDPLFVTGTRYACIDKNEAGLGRCGLACLYRQGLPCLEHQDINPDEIGDGDHVDVVCRVSEMRTEISCKCAHKTQLLYKPANDR